jgi:hypothetical protein
MATSGSTDYTSTKLQIITSALEYVDALATGQTVPAADNAMVSRSLNTLVKSLQLQGVNLWARTRIEEVLTATDVRTGSDGNNYGCIRSHTSTTATKPITGANWTSFWKKTDETSGGAWADATSYNYIGDFTLNSQYINVDRAYIREETGNLHYDYPVQIQSFGAYMEITDKSTIGRGVPTGLFFEEQLSGMTGYLWPTPEEGMILHMLATRTIEDFDADGDTPDYPVRWHKALELGTAVDIAPKYGVWGSRLGQLRGMYEAELKLARKDDKETTTSFMTSAYLE